MWNPREVRKLIALFAGIGIIIAGIVLMVNQVNANGTIDINSSILSGKIESGSAGLLLCFFGTFMIIFSILGGKYTHITSHSVKSIDETKKDPGTFELNLEQRRLLVSFIIGIILSTIFIVAGLYLESKEILKGGVIFTVAGVVMGAVTFLLIFAFIFSFLSDDSSKTEELDKKDGAN